MKPLYDILVTPKSQNDIFNCKQSTLWEGFHQKLLDEVIDYLKSPEIFSYLDFSHHFIILCDVSQKEFGAVLYKKLGKWKLPALLLEHYHPLKKIISIV